MLANEHPNEITILSNRAFFWPLFWPDNLASIFAANESIVGPETLATHLWENKARRYLELLTPGKVRRAHNNFAIWATPYLAGLPDDFAAPGAWQRLQNTIGRLHYVRVEYSWSNFPER
jgi:hypothetical protein